MRILKLFPEKIALVFKAANRRKFFMLKSNTKGGESMSLKEQYDAIFGEGFMTEEMEKGLSDATKERLLAAAADLKPFTEDIPEDIKKAMQAVVAAIGEPPEVEDEVKSEGETQDTEDKTTEDESTEETQKDESTEETTTEDEATTEAVVEVDNTEDEVKAVLDGLKEKVDVLTQRLDSVEGDDSLKKALETLSTEQKKITDSIAETQESLKKMAETSAEPHSGGGEDYTPRESKGEDVWDDPSLMPCIPSE